MTDEAHDGFFLMNAEEFSGIADPWPKGHFKFMKYISESFLQAEPIFQILIQAKILSSLKILYFFGNFFQLKHKLHIFRANFKRNIIFISFHPKSAYLSEGGFWKFVVELYCIFAQFKFFVYCYLIRKNLGHVSQVDNLLLEFHVDWIFADLEDPHSVGVKNGPYMGVVQVQLHNDACKNLWGLSDYPWRNYVADLEEELYMIFS